MQLSLVSYNIGTPVSASDLLKEDEFQIFLQNKNKYLSTYLSKTDVDIICLQEYTKETEIILDNYLCIKDYEYAIFYRKHRIKYRSHTYDAKIGLSAIFEINSSSGSDSQDYDNGLTQHESALTFEIINKKLPSAWEAPKSRNCIMNSIDNIALNKNLILTVNINSNEVDSENLCNIRDCFRISDHTEGEFTLDKRQNPYFLNDLSRTNRLRTDRVYCSDSFSVKKFIVLHPSPSYNLINDSLPFGNVSDHYPVLVIFQFEFD